MPWRSSDRRRFKPVFATPSCASCRHRAGRTRWSCSWRICTGSTAAPRNSSRPWWRNFRAASLLLITTTRPGYSAPWVGKSYAAQLPLPCSPPRRAGRSSQRDPAHRAHGVGDGVDPGESRGQSALPRRAYAGAGDADRRLGAGSARYDSGCPGCAHRSSARSREARAADGFCARAGSSHCACSRQLRRSSPRCTSSSLCSCSSSFYTSEAKPKGRCTRSSMR